jgi:hypothetical protein
MTILIQTDHRSQFRHARRFQACLTAHKRSPFAEMRESGVRGVLVYCADYRCSHSVAVSAPFSPRRAASTH